jgi:hypothetical protein
MALVLIEGDGMWYQKMEITTLLPLGRECGKILLWFAAAIYLEIWGQRTIVRRTQYLYGTLYSWSRRLYYTLHDQGDKGGWLICLLAANLWLCSMIPKTTRIYGIGSCTIVFSKLKQSVET